MRSVQHLDIIVPQLVRCVRGTYLQLRKWGAQLPQVDVHCSADGAQLLAPRYHSYAVGAPRPRDIATAAQDGSAASAGKLSVLRSWCAVFST